MKQFIYRSGLIPQIRLGKQIVNIFCTVLLLTLWGLPAASAELQYEKISVGYIKSQLQGLNRQDAEAAFKTLSRTLGVQNGYDIDVSVVSFADAREVADYFTHSTLNILIMDSWNYLDLCHIKELEPVFAHYLNDSIMQKYMLIVKDRDIKNVSELKGKALNMMSGSGRLIAEGWLQSLLQAQGISGKRQFLGKLSHQRSPASTVLPVFFGKIDAAIIEESKFTLMKELNPQLNSLRAISVSEPFLLSLICFGRNSWPTADLRELMIKTVKSLPKTPAGQQILTLFKTDDVKPFEQQYLESLQKLKHGAKGDIQACGTTESNS